MLVINFHLCFSSLCPFPFLPFLLRVVRATEVSTPKEIEIPTNNKQLRQDKENDTQHAHTHTSLIGVPSPSAFSSLPLVCCFVARCRRPRRCSVPTVRPRSCGQHTHRDTPDRQVGHRNGWGCLRETCFFLLLFSVSAVVMISTIAVRARVRLRSTRDPAVAHSYHSRNIRR